jgi:hypothetical protein
MATSSSAGRSRSIRHPQDTYNGAELLSSSTGPSYNGGHQQMGSRGGGPPQLSPPSSSSNPVTTRSSVAEFEDLLYQANYAANHYETQPQSQQSQTQSPTSQSFGHRQPSQRSKTPDARRVRNSLQKPNPNPNYMATGTPPRPSRNNTQNLNDYRNDDQRERRLSLPSANSSNDRDYYQPQLPSDFNQGGTLSSMPPARSRSGTQSNKNKKGMLSFMSGKCTGIRSRILFANTIPSPSNSLWYPEKARNQHSIRSRSSHACRL